MKHTVRAAFFCSGYCGSRIRQSVRSRYRTRLTSVGELQTRTVDTIICFLLTGLGPISPFHCHLLRPGMFPNRSVFPRAVWCDVTEVSRFRLFTVASISLLVTRSNTASFVACSPCEIFKLRLYSTTYQMPRHRTVGLLTESKPRRRTVCDY